jgi:hypothetical protein
MLPHFLSSHSADDALRHPQAGRVPVPITSGIVSKDAVKFSGQSQFPLGGSIEIRFHGN